MTSSTLTRIAPVTETSDFTSLHCTLFAPIPDPVGYAGGFAASLNGRLISGGGSQLPEKPLWLGGQKAFSNRIFALSDPHGNWSELETRLPHAMAHFAFAASGEAIYLVGGTTESGLLSECFELRPAGRELTIRPLPNLPKALVYGTAAVANGRLYVMGGQHDAAAKAATTECWSLELGAVGGSASGWQPEPDLPGTGTFVAAAASDGANVFVIGGVGFDADGKGVPSNQAFRLIPHGTQWEPLPDLPEPRVGPVTPCPIINEDTIFVMGGYATPFAGERRDHPGFSSQTFLYDIVDQTWRNGPVLPHVKPLNKDATSDPGPAPMVAAPGAVWRDYFVSVGGEVRASVRTTAVVGYPLSCLQAPPRFT